MPKVKPFKGELEELLSLMTVRATKDGGIVSATKELETMEACFKKYVWDCTLVLAESDAIDKEDPDDGKLKKMTDKIKALIVNSEHHYNGAKGAKTRFRGILGLQK